MPDTRGFLPARRKGAYFDKIHMIKKGNEKNLNKTNKIMQKREKNQKKPCNYEFFVL